MQDKKKFRHLRIALRFDNNERKKLTTMSQRFNTDYLKQHIKFRI